MRKRLFTFAAAAVLLAPASAWAGQAGSVLEATDDTVVENAIASTTVVGGIEITVEDATVTTNATTTALDSSAVTLSLQVFESGYHGNSPSNNIASFEGDLIQLNEGWDSSAGGLSTGQQAQGNANVSVSANTFVDLVSLGALDTLTSGDGSGDGVMGMILSPAFAVSNSKQAAQVLAIAALSDTILAGAAGDAVAIEFVSEGSYELSPESNIANFAGALDNTISGAATAGITTLQQAQGNANVQSSFNTFLYGQVGLSDVYVVGP